MYQFLPREAPLVDCPNNQCTTLLRITITLFTETLGNFNRRLSSLKRSLPAATDPRLTLASPGIGDVAALLTL